MAYHVKEWWEGVTKPIPLAVGAAMTLGCIIAGPFGTIDAPITLRAGYWLPVNLLAFFYSTFIFEAFERTEQGARLPRWVRITGGAFVFAAPFTLVAVGHTWLIFGRALDVLPLMASVWLIAVVIRVIVDLFRNGATPERSAPVTARIWKRVPPKLGRDLVRLSVQDHYVEVHTTLGMELVLMRFSDAMAELEGIAGHQTHRSHWVADAAIAESVRRDGRVFLRLRDGTDIPVSRSFQPALREMGLL
ncbi:MAG: LytTR family DNA-binding domain-containing protein [Pseudomonadota bacterium]